MQQHPSVFSVRRTLSYTIGAILLLAVAGSSMACGGAPAAQPTTAPGKSPTASVKEQGAAQPAQAGTVVAKLAHVLSDDHCNQQAYLFFNDRLKTLTNGKLSIRIFPNSQLGNEREYVEQLQVGQIEFARVSTAVLGPFVPQFQVFDLPYLFPTRQHRDKAADGELGQILLKLLEERLDIKGLGFFDDGSRSLYNSKRPVVTPADLKGMKVRVMENQLMIKTFNALGAASTPMAFGEVYSALQQGVVDASEGPAAGYASVKHYEVAKYYSFTEHFMTPALPMVSMKWFNTQPKEIQQAIVQAGMEMAIKERQLWAESEDKIVTDLKAKGTQFNDVPDKAPFAKLVESIYGEYEGKIGKDLIDKARNVK